MSTHSSILAWRIPWTEEPGGLYSPWGCKEPDTTAVTERACTPSKILGRVSLIYLYMGFPGGTSGKEPLCQHRRYKKRGFNPWVRKIRRRRAWQPTSAFLPGESHGQRSLVGYSPWGHQESESDMTEVTKHTHLYVFVGFKLYIWANI